MNSTNTKRRLAISPAAIFAVGYELGYANGACDPPSKSEALKLQDRDAELARFLRARGGPPVKDQSKKKGG